MMMKILTLGSTEEDSIAVAKEMVMLIIDPPEAEVGESMKENCKCCFVRCFC